ncbi:hypothetical protein DL93DRAFT_1678737 [Clavulina sp. PMI_390]|nr:hypothetical protein DL93DRAFT_1678737 [Clavulina sp. PMI_390]
MDPPISEHHDQPAAPHVDPTFLSPEPPHTDVVPHLGAITKSSSTPSPKSTGSVSDDSESITLGGEEPNDDCEAHSPIDPPQSTTRPLPQVQNPPRPTPPCARHRTSFFPNLCLSPVCEVPEDNFPSPLNSLSPPFPRPASDDLGESDELTTALMFYSNQFNTALDDGQIFDKSAEWSRLGDISLSDFPLPPGAQSFSASLLEDAFTEPHKAPLQRPISVVPNPLPSPSSDTFSMVSPRNSLPFSLTPTLVFSPTSFRFSVHSDDDADVNDPGTDSTHPLYRSQPGTAVVNPASGFVDEPLAEDWRHAIDELYLISPHPPPSSPSPSIPPPHVPIAGIDPSPKAAAILGMGIDAVASPRSAFDDDELGPSGTVSETQKAGRKRHFKFSLGALHLPSLPQKNHSKRRPASPHSSLSTVFDGAAPEGLSYSSVTVSQPLYLGDHDNGHRDGGEPVPIVGTSLWPTEMAVVDSSGKGIQSLEGHHDGHLPRLEFEDDTPLVKPPQLMTSPTSMVANDYFSLTPAASFSSTPSTPLGSQKHYLYDQPHHVSDDLSQLIPPLSSLASSTVSQARTPGSSSLAISLLPIGRGLLRSSSIPRSSTSPLSSPSSSKLALRRAAGPKKKSSLGRLKKSVSIDSLRVFYSERSAESGTGAKKKSNQWGYPSRHPSPRSWYRGRL